VYTITIKVVKIKYDYPQTMDYGALYYLLPFVCVFQQARSTPNWGWTDRRKKDRLQKVLTVSKQTKYLLGPRLVRIAKKRSKTVQLVLHRQRPYTETKHKKTYWSKCR